MKYIVFVIAALAALQYVGCALSQFDDSSEFNEQDNMILIRESLQNSRARATLERLRSKVDDLCPGYGRRLENVTMEMAACAQTIDESKETMCSVIKNYAKRCVSPLTNMLEECLPTQAKQIPSMSIDMVISASNHLCKTDGEHIFELGNSCVKNINDKTERCIRRIVTKFQQYQRKESLPSARDVCDILVSLRPCLQSHLNSACGHPVTRESFLSVFDESMKTCKNYEKIEIQVVDIDAN